MERRSHRTQRREFALINKILNLTINVVTPTEALTPVNIDSGANNRPPPTHHDLNERLFLQTPDAELILVPVMAAYIYLLVRADHRSKLIDVAVRVCASFDFAAAHLAVFLKARDYLEPSRIVGSSSRFNISPHIKG